MVAFLVASKAEVSARDRWGTTPLSDAVRGGHTRVQNILREAGAAGSLDDHTDHTTKIAERLCHAAAKGNLAELRMLLVQSGIAVNTTDCKYGPIIRVNCPGHAYPLTRCFAPKQMMAEVRFTLRPQRATPWLSSTSSSSAPRFTAATGVPAAS